MFVISVVEFAKNSLVCDLAKATDIELSWRTLLKRTLWAHTTNQPSEFFSFKETTKQQASSFCTQLELGATESFSLNRVELRIW